MGLQAQSKLVKSNEPPSTYMGLTWLPHTTNLLGVLSTSGHGALCPLPALGAVPRGSVNVDVKMAADQKEEQEHQNNANEIGKTCTMHELRSSAAKCKDVRVDVIK